MKVDRECRRFKDKLKLEYLLLDYTLEILFALSPTIRLKRSNATFFLNHFYFFSLCKAARSDLENFPEQLYVLEAEKGCTIGPSTRLHVLNTQFHFNLRLCKNTSICKHMIAMIMLIFNRHSARLTFVSL